MKRPVLALFLGAACATPTAQAPAPATAAPAPATVAAVPAEPAPVVEGDVTEGRVGAMTVLVKRIPTAELVAAQLYVKGGALDWTAATAGVEQVAFRVAASGGAGTLDKAAFARRLAGLGAEVRAETTRDWSMVEAKGPLASADELLTLQAEVFLRPLLPAGEVEVARQRQLVGLQQRDENPDGRLQVLLDEVRFKGHPYQARPEGTPASVKALTREQLAAHLGTLREQARLVLVVVGNVDFPVVQALARSLYGGLPRGPAPAAMPALAPPTAASFTAESRPLPTNYLTAVFRAPAPGTPAYAAATVANALLRDRLFFEVRTKRNLSYAPGSRFELTAAGTFGGLYVTAVDPPTTWKVMLDECRRLQSQPVPAEELAGAKAQTRTGMLMRQASTDGQASSLAGGLLLTGDWRFRARLAEQVKAVTAEEVQAYARESMGRLQVVLLGDPAKLDPTLATGL